VRTSPSTLAGNGEVTSSLPASPVPRPSPQGRPLSIVSLRSHPVHVLYVFPLTYGLLAAAALLLDYILVVASGISAGIGALVSAVPVLQPYTLTLCLITLAFIANQHVMLITKP